MKVHIAIHLNVEDSISASRATFYVKDSDFKKDADFAVGIIAYEWIQSRRREFGFRRMEIEKVIWDEQHDITDLVKQIRPIEPPDDLPF
ncbi:hypothetical protein [Cytobacillus solani]|uniref:Uncharacterized protein n=1 Tax=Cytobacillus solani TaxID=1637975 RepID=A0A0Q3QS06_9BACI|nr:hypothetical protein [Cytobacillus solani]KQL20462.1 hypothetical protein AN957_18950 [Cytobacillus solani]